LLTSLASKVPPLPVVSTAGRLLARLTDLPRDFDSERLVRSAVRAGLPRARVPQALDLLREAGFVQRKGEVWELSQDGTEVARHLREGDWS